MQTIFKNSVLPRLAAFAVIALALSTPLPAFAEDHDGHKGVAADRSDSGKDPGVIRGEHVEGHIAFLHAELRITPDQEALWAPVAAAMRQDVDDMQRAEAQVAENYQGHDSATQYLYNRAMFASLRADGESRFYNAFAPLYDHLSADQKQDADDLFVPPSARDDQ